MIITKFIPGQKLCSSVSEKTVFFSVDLTGKNLPIISRLFRIIQRYCCIYDVYKSYIFVIVANRIAKKLPKDVNKHSVFACNELDLDEIQVYGFDYDYTLACYNKSLHYLLYNLGRDILIERFKVTLGYRVIFFHLVCAVNSNVCLMVLHFSIRKESGKWNFVLSLPSVDSTTTSRKGYC